MTKFKVKKGKKFFAGPRWNFIGIDTGEFNVRACFMDDCLYRLSENYDQINKLVGQSYRLLPFYDKKTGSWKPGHQKESVRFGWRCVDGLEIEIFAYAYIGGIRKEKRLLSVKPGEWVHLSFNETKSYYYFRAISENGDAEMLKFRKSKNKKSFLRLFIGRLYPYFGGKVASPHDMTIELMYF